MNALNRSNRSVMALIRRQGFKKLLSLSLRHKYLYITVLLLQLAETGASLLLAETGRRLFDQGAKLTESALTRLIAGIIAFVFVGLALSLLSRIFNQIVNTNVVFRMRQMVLSQLTRVSLSRHESRHSSHAESILFNELEVFKQFIVFDVLRLISLPFSFIAVGLYLLTVHPVLGTIAICVGPLQLLGSLVIKESFKDTVARQQANGGEVFFHMGETLAGMREVKMNQLEQSVFDRFDRICREGIKLWISVEKMEAIRDLIRQLPEKIGYVLGLGIGALLMVRGEVGPGALVAFITLLAKASEPFAHMAGIVGSLQRVSSGAENLLDTMELPVERDGDGLPLSPEPPSIQFENVSFAYLEGPPVLKQVSFTIPAGKSVALVGPSGGGKSTLIKLLYRFYSPQEGTIRMNGLPIEDYSLESLRGHLAAVTQEVYLFDDTIRANIAIGAEGAGDAEIGHAARLSQSSSFIEALPERFETRVGERGIKLSHGQRQRIGIARAILRKASILVMDEPTSALDVETEAVFQRNMNDWAGASTKIIIAHRLSTIRDVDYIVFLENGAVREMGSPRELLGSGGRFADFWRSQDMQAFVS